MKRIVIIGGGFSGSYCAKHLEEDFAVTLIDTKDHFEFTPSVLRTLVEPEHARKIQVLHTHYLKKAQVVRDCVDHLDTQRVYTKKGKYSYDYLIISSGSRYNAPIKGENMVVVARAHELRDYAAKLRDAQKVLIIGGGVVGVELAAEVCCAYPQKKITIVHSKKRLLERSPPKAQRFAEKFLRKRGVEIIFGEKVIKNKFGSYITNKGRMFHPKMAFLCTGIVPNYEHLLKNFKGKLSERHYLCVDKNLRVVGTSNIFAAGDITNIKEEKTAQNAQQQAHIIVENIRHLEGREELEKYVSEPRAMVISLGKNHGTITYKNFALTGIFPGILKRFIEWKSMRMYK